MTDRLNVAMEAEGEDPIPYAQVQETFKNLVKCRFLERLPANASAATAAEPPAPASVMLGEEQRFLVPNVSMAQIVGERKKRRRSGTEGDEGQGGHRGVVEESCF